jgi:hypothetical protein
MRKTNSNPGGTPYFSHCPTIGCAGDPLCPNRELPLSSDFMIFSYKQGSILANNNKKNALVFTEKLNGIYQDDIQFFTRFGTSVCLPTCFLCSKSVSQTITLQFLLGLKNKSQIFP